jgi:hypothetical protein
MSNYKCCPSCGCEVVVSRSGYYDCQLCGYNGHESELVESKEDE